MNTLKLDLARLVCSLTCHLVFVVFRFDGSSTSYEELVLVFNFVLRVIFHLFGSHIHTTHIFVFFRFLAVSVSNVLQLSCPSTLSLLQLKHLLPLSYS